MVIKGCPDFDTHVDRAKAIKLAITQAGSDDVVIIAGKGHETEQIIGDQQIPFDDYKVAKEVMETL